MPVSVRASPPAEMPVSVRAPPFRAFAQGMASVIGIMEGETEAGQDGGHIMWKACTSCPSGPRRDWLGSSHAQLARGQQGGCGCLGVVPVTRLAQSVHGSEVAPHCSISVLSLCLKRCLVQGPSPTILYTIHKWPEHWSPELKTAA